MRTLKLTIAYDGTRYAGWQVQRSTKHTALSTQQQQRPTIQGTLERILRQVLQEPVHVIGSGRTDAGVHAEAQVAHVKTRSAMPVERLQRSINHLLPTDIAVTALEEASPRFQAQFHATGKWYRYRWYLGEVVPPFIRPYICHVRVPLQVGRMRRELAILKGRHDFRAFARVDNHERRPLRQQQAAGRGTGAGARSAGRTTVRQVTDVQLKRRGSELHLEIKGSGFLHTMVRSIAGTLIDVGRGRLPAGTVARMLRTKHRALAGTTAPAKGLTLVSVTYGYHKRERPH
ncbi:MAG: tRNA pseudouridine synthase A [Candidatus Omnitrophica bacterium]|nr:tRNA pseudouridine synthase A [Candidatus Omnitrophota bacterium]